MASIPALTPNRQHHVARFLRLVAVLSLVLACRRPIEARGLYATDVKDVNAGIFLPCDQPTRRPWRVRDSTLAATYRLKASKPYEPLFVRVRGVGTDSGSVYDSQHHLLVREILEVRAPKDGECHAASQGLHISRY
jgi:hypothetical protein